MQKDLLFSNQVFIVFHCHFSLNYYSVYLLPFLLQYTFYATAKDEQGEILDKPLEIQIVVEDVNDNPPVCQKALTIFEVQENENVGKKIFFDPILQKHSLGLNAVSVKDD